MPLQAKGTRGYTLVELAVVIVIAGILMAAAAPSFTRRNAWSRLEGSGRELSSSIQLARQAAVARRTPYRITLDPVDLTYIVERQMTESTWAPAPDEVFQFTGVSDMTADIGSSSGHVIHFETRGTIAAADAPAEIRLISSQGDTAVLVLVRTGRITMRMGRHEG